MNDSNPLWIAPRTGQNWRDEGILRAIDWFCSLVPTRAWERRTEVVRSRLMKAQKRWAEGRQVPLFDARDLIAWYMFQAETFAIDRQYWVPEVIAKIAPILTRIGQELALLQSVRGSEERAARLMTGEKAQPDGAFFELLVALAYRRRGWTHVEFVPERRGIEKTPDLVVSRPRRKWSIECKRLGVSRYAAAEKEHGEKLAKPIHDLSLSASRSIIVEIVYLQELLSLPEDYLIRYVEAYLADPLRDSWTSTESVGKIRNIDWDLIRKVLRHDFVYYGSSRMIELLVGTYNHQYDYSMAAKWRPAQERPLYADAVYQASVVSWSSVSNDSVTQKVRHFRSTIAKANDQLFTDVPGAIHVGVESWSGPSVDATRHILNLLESKFFDTRSSRLRWVYGNYFAPELTTQRDESWAMYETMVPYKIGHHSTREPLPGHLLLTPEQDMREGVHWE